MRHSYVTDDIVDAFARDGVVHLPNVLEPTWMQLLETGITRRRAGPRGTRTPPTGSPAATRSPASGSPSMTHPPTNPSNSSAGHTSDRPTPAPRSTTTKRPPPSPTKPATTRSPIDSLLRRRRRLRAEEATRPDLPGHQRFDRTGPAAARPVVPPSPPSIRGNPNHRRFIGPRRCQWSPPSNSGSASPTST